MTSWTFYPVFLGTLVSVTGLTRLAATLYDKAKPTTLSELVTIERKSLLRFRNILLFCGSLFAITMFGFIVPRAPHFWITLLLSLVIIISELLVGVIPAHKNSLKLHEALAEMMGVGMLGMVYVFAFSFNHIWQFSELALAILMTVLAAALFADRSKRRFVVYELLFIFSSHLSIVLAAIALR